jgi:hypothetical protein
MELNQEGEREGMHDLPKDSNSFPSFNEQDWGRDSLGLGA